MDFRGMSVIRRLSDDIINQIAAGEIVERPSSALKEIIENSIDANSKNISIFIKNGGKSKIVVEDDGFGMSAEDLKMCVERHATSKLQGMNLFDIRSYGFRGEALPSIASISNFLIESNGNSLEINFSKQNEMRPSSFERGTRVSVCDIFDRLPVRLKFLKSDNVEQASCIAIIENFALVNRDINFSIRDENKVLFSSKDESIEKRISKIYGKEAFERSIFVSTENENMKVYGYIFHPIDAKYTMNNQRIFINNRIVKDKNVSSSIKIGYKDILDNRKFASSILFIEIDPFFVDVNISPTKSEVRFRDPASIQKILINLLRKNIHQFDRNSVSISEIASSLPKLNSFVQNNPNNYKNNKINFEFDASHNPHNDADNNQYSETSPSETVYTFDDDDDDEHPQNSLKFCENSHISYEVNDDEDHNNTPKNDDESQDNNHYDEQNINNNAPENFFGDAICQIFGTYIISKKDDELFLIDQHAVHEKIVQEEIKQKISDHNTQYIMKPEIIELTLEQSERINNIKNHLSSCGFKIDILKESVIISAIPGVLNIEEATEFVSHVVEIENENISTLDMIIDKISTIACHNSIRSGRTLSIPEMNALLRKMEQTKTICQCNHHRPSFIKISKKDINKMFERE